MLTLDTQLGSYRPARGRAGRSVEPQPRLQPNLAISIFKAVTSVCVGRSKGNGDAELKLFENYVSRTDTSSPGNGPMPASGSDVPA